MEKKMEKKTLFRIIAIILALLIVIGVVAAVLATCDEDTAGKKKKKKVIKKVVVQNNDDDDDDDDDIDDDDDDSYDDYYEEDDDYEYEEEEEEEEDTDEDEYANDDIALTLDYNGKNVFSLEDLITASQKTSDVIEMNAYNGSDPICTSFRGTTGAVYWSTEFIQESDPYGKSYTEDMIRHEFKRLADAGFTYLRTGYWSDWMYSGDDNNPWDWESERMQGFYKFCKMAEEYGFEVIIVLGWGWGKLFSGGDMWLTEVPYLRPTLTDANGNPIIEYHFGFYHTAADWDLLNERYAQWGVETIQALNAHGVHNANHLLLGNEPHENGGLAEGAYWEWQIATYSALHEALIDAGIRDQVTMYGPNQSAPSGAAGLAQKFMSLAPDVFDVYTSHMCKIGQTPIVDMYSINYSGFLGYMQAMDNYGLRFKKEFWLDEFGGHGFLDGATSDVDDPWMALHWGTSTLAAINAGISGINYWQIYAQNWPDYYGSGGEYEWGIQKSGMIPSTYMTEVPYSSWYACSLYAKYMSQEGSTTYHSETLDDEGSSSLHIATVKLADGNWSVAVTNHSTENRTFNINFEESLGGVTMYRYKFTVGHERTAAGKVITADKGFTNVTTDLVDTLPGGSVVIYSTIKNIDE